MTLYQAVEEMMESVELLRLTWLTSRVMGPRI